MTKVHTTARVPVAVAGSGAGTICAAIIEHAVRGPASYTVVRIITTSSKAGIIDVAAKYNIAVDIVSKPYPAPQSQSELNHSILSSGARVLVLAGWLRLIAPDVIDQCNGHVLNSHPALLPRWGGKGMYGRKVHQAVVSSGDKLSGMTIHKVNERYDEGRILLQSPVPVLEGDTAATLEYRVKAVERQAYPLLLDSYCKCLRFQKCSDHIFRSSKNEFCNF